MNSLILTLAAALAAAPALAQPPGPPGGRRGPDHLAEELGLSEDQRASWAALHEAHREETKGLFEEGRKLHETLRAALAAPTPDPATVGRAAIAADRHRQRMEAARQALEAKLVALLDEEQKERFDEMRKERGPGGPGPRGPHGPGGFGPPPPPPDVE